MDGRWGGVGFIAASGVNHSPSSQPLLLVTFNYGTVPEMEFNKSHVTRTI